MSKKIRIGINGFGVIGRTFFRVNAARKLFDVVAINDLNGSVENLAYLMKYDSTHGTLKDDIRHDKNEIIFSGCPIRISSEPKIEDVSWRDCHVDVVVECTGVLRNVANAKKCIGGSVKKIVFSDSPRGTDFTFVFGVNEGAYDHEKHDTIGGSICDVVGLAPALKIIDERYGIKSGLLLTLHPFLFYQNIKDGKPNPDVIKDPNGTPHAIGRASIDAVIPKNTSLIQALDMVLPSMHGKFKGMSYRVPTNLVGSAHSVLIVGKDIEADEVREFLKASRALPILDYTEEPLVSTDYKHHDASCVIDGKWIEVVDRRLLRIVTWYDNEWGYASRLADIIQHVSRGLTAAGVPAKTQSPVRRAHHEAVK